MGNPQHGGLALPRDDLRTELKADPYKTIRHSRIDKRRDRARVKSL